MRSKKIFRLKNPERQGIMTLSFSIAEKQWRNIFFP
jgi:hypothetical protein